MQYVKNLDDYIFYTNSKSCQLNEKYFNLVLAEYPGLVKEPLCIKKDKDAFYITMKKTPINTEFPALIRLEIKTPEEKYSNLLIVDYQDGKIHRFDPLGKYNRYSAKINELIEGYLGIFFNCRVFDIDLDEVLDGKNMKCKRSGFSTAYVLLYAYSFLTHKDFNPRKILKFVKKIEETF